MALKKTESYVTIPALELGTQHLGKYAEQLEKFDKHIKKVTSDLGDSHKDQKYDEFMNEFEVFWPKILAFKEDVLKFNQFLGKKKKHIEDTNNITFGK